MKTTTIFYDFVDWLSGLGVSHGCIQLPDGLTLIKWIGAGFWLWGLDALDLDGLDFLHDDSGFYMREIEAARHVKA